MTVHFADQFSRPQSGRDAFQNILRFISTSDHETRQERRASHKLAPIREVWKIFTKKLSKVSGARIGNVC